MSAAEFNQRPSQVKRAAESGPVVITEHSRPAYVLLTYQEYERLRSAPVDLAAHLEMPNYEFPARHERRQRTAQT